MQTTVVPKLVSRKDKLERIHGIYKSLEGAVSVTRDLSYKDQVCPKNWQDHPFDRWYKLKEGYSSVMIERLLDELGARQGDWVLDPFLGSGSTLVGARRAGIHGAGFEVNPFLSMLSTVKLADHGNGEALGKAFNDVVERVATMDSYTIDLPKLSITEKLFGEQLAEVMKTKQAIHALDVPRSTRDFLLLGLGCVLEKVCHAKKDGNGLKYPKSKVPRPFMPTLKEQVGAMVEDVKHLHASRQRARERVKGTGARRHDNKHLVFKGDSRSISADARSLISGAESDIDDFTSNVRFAIFSPPYANCFDYTEVYKIELWMLDFILEYEELKDLRNKSLSSHLNKPYTDIDPCLPELGKVLDMIPWEKTWGKTKMRNMVASYFDDMRQVFNTIDGLFGDDGGTIVCIVGNSAYGNLPVATDVFLSKMLMRMGYDDVEIRVARPLSTSSQQQKYLRDDPYLRESLVIAQRD